MSEAAEQEARAIGWKPKEEFPGDPEKWVDAETFLERGNTFIPLLKKEKERLSQQVSQLTGELASVKSVLGESQEAIKALLEFHDSDAKRRAKEAKENVEAALEQAHEAGDHKAAAKLTTELVQLTEAEKTANELAKAPKTTSPPPKDHMQEAWFKSWLADNEWYGQDALRTATANLVAQNLKARGESSVGREFLDKVTEGVEKEFEKLGGGKVVTGKVSGGAPRGNGSGGKTYADLPPEAKAACDSDARKLVGPNRAFKDMKAWQKYYIENYFGDENG